ncbi:MAG: ABC transporter permease [Anaerolineales bacterium]|nr:ABC transporter permease [Anaerolineales bacterium]
MKKILTILKNEVVTLLSRPSFWLTTLGLPVVAALVFGVIGGLNRNQTASLTFSLVLLGPQETRPEGYVDESGLIREIPESVPPGTFLAYPDEASARRALEAGEIAAYYIVPADYIQRGEIRYIRPDFNPLAGDSAQSDLFTWVLKVNLAGGDWRLVNLAQGPLEVEEISLAPAAAPNEDNPATMWVPYTVTLLYYILIIGSATLLLNSISKEKENRIMEVLLTSASSRQLLTGKIIALGLVGLLQTILWGGTTYVLLNLSGRTFNLPSEIRLPPDFLAWGVIFFLLGYAVYASLMAGLGALAPNLREASQVTFVILLPLIVPLFFSNNVFASDPHGALATGLSLFPLSAPVAMMARLSMGGVAWWQPPLSALLLAATAVLIVRAVAGMFRAQVMLSGQPIKIKTYVQALMGKI